MGVDQGRQKSGATQIAGNEAKRSTRAERLPSDRAMSYAVSREIKTKSRAAKIAEGLEKRRAARA